MRPEHPCGRPPAPAAATTYTYDALSNLLATTVAGTPSHVTQYTYEPGTGEPTTSMIRVCQGKTELPLHLDEFPEAP